MAKSRRKRQRKRGSRDGPRPAYGRVSGLEQELERAVDEMRRRAAEAHSPDTPSERIARILVEDFEGLPSPVGFAHTLAEQDPERAKAVLAEMRRLASADLVTLTFAADVARTVEGDPAGSLVLLEQTLDLVLDANAAGPLAMHLLNAGMVVEALEAVDECLHDAPGDETGQKVLAAALQQLHMRAESAERLDPVEREALDRFSDRTRLYRLRDSMVAFTEARPELQALIATTMKEWLEELAANDLIDLDELVEGSGELVYERHEGFMRLAIERAWLREEEDDLDEEQGVFGLEPRPEIEESGAPMALLATHAETPPEIARAARNWTETCTYGLWQISDTTPTPGVWVTDIVSGVRRYAAVPPEQLEPAGPWGVLMGALVAIDGIWRTTGAVAHLRPTEADSAAEFVREATHGLVRALTGKRTRRDANRRREPQPHGVLVDAAEPADALLADLISKVIGSLLPTIAGDAWRRRAAGPTLTNTDGHRLKLITAHVNVDDPATAAERLAAHHDFRTEDDGELTWWGRELTEMEQQSALAHLHAQFGEEDPVDNPEETPRWLRGRLKRRNGGFEVEVNSEERLGWLLELLDGLGLKPSVARRSAIDPPQDMPPIQLGGPMPFGSSQEAIDAWLAHWADERVPGLGGVTPRAAAKKKQMRPRLEALLRKFEHDAHQLARSGKPAPDVGRLREALGMELWWAEKPISR